MQSDTQSFTSIGTPEHKDDFTVTTPLGLSANMPSFPNIVASLAGLASSTSHKVSCSRHVAVPAKLNFHDSTLLGDHESSQA
jgi:hypothetical protein